MSNSDFWQVYIIESDDDRLYTGITTDIEHRWEAHLSGKGAKFFRGRKPRQLRYLENNHNKSSASRREAEIKKLSRAEKLVLIASNTNQLDQQSHFPVHSA